MKNLGESLHTYDLILVDTLNLATISFYAKSTLSYEGRKTGMVFGVLQAVEGLRRRYPEAKICFLWEGFNSIRKSRHPFYKSQRRQKDDSYSSSLRDLEEMIGYLDVHQARHTGLEADDLAGYFCQKYACTDKRILLVSNDRDWWGFVRENVAIFMHNEEFTMQDLYNELNFPPSKMPLLKVLRGDPSDNVGGVSRFPSKLAVEMVKRSDGISDFIPVLTEIAQSKTELKWLDVLKSEWHIVERNADLVLFHPEWIQQDCLKLIKPNVDEVKLRAFLTSRGVFSLIPKFCPNT